MGTRGYFPRAKRRVREADYSPPSCDAVKNGGVIPPLPPHVFMSWCLTTPAELSASYYIKTGEELTLKKFSRNCCCNSVLIKRNPVFGFHVISCESNVSDSECFGRVSRMFYNT
jgi:hypothetical protein